MLKVMHIFMEHVHILWHLMAFYIRNLAAKGLMNDTPVTKLKNFSSYSYICMKIYVLDFHFFYS